MQIYLTWLLQALLWLLLAGWLGSFGLFAFAVAPTAFQVLPSQEAAGALVAPLLATLHGYGAIAGVAAAGLSWLLGRGWLRTALPLGLALLCIYTEYVVTPEINAVQPRSFGASQEPEAAARFSHLHQVSRYVFGAVELGVFALVVLHARPARHPIGGAEAPTGAQGS